jgi:peptidyl-prolyl cis-trans isomerase C
MSLIRNRVRTVALTLMLGVASTGWAQNAAVVNNKAIPKQKVDDFVAALAAQGRPDSPELRAAVRDELIARELFSQEAEKKGLMRNAEVQRQLDNARQEILIRALIRDHLKANPITDAELKSEYDKVAKSGGDKEYKARHVLVEKEEDAKKVIEQLKKGAKFEDLAKQSKDTGSAAKGGDLDWNGAGTFVKPFSDAMVKLEKGKFTETPVQTQFGWHVIRLDDVRESSPPPLEQVKPQIQQELERRRVQTLQQDLRTKAKIQ